MPRDGLVVASIAFVVGSILLLTGALDGNRAAVNIDAASAATTGVPTPTTTSANRVTIDYLTALRAFSTCAEQSSESAAAAACGTLPPQPDDPQLNAYLSSVLDWNKCAAPRLRHGGMTYAVDACGPQPVSPLGG